MAKSIFGANPRINIVASARDLLHDVRLVRNCLEAQIERLNRIELELSVLVPRSGVDAHCTVELGAGPVAHNLEIQPLPDGSAMFAIDGGSTFSLGPRLAAVFQLIASGEKDRTSQDALVGWRSRVEIIAFMEKHAGKSFSKKYINHMVYLLKQVLQKAGYDQKLIQTHRQKGIRLAYKYAVQGSPRPGQDSQ